MKTRPKYFLSDDKISHNGEQFDYIVELHDYLWRFVRATNSGANGNLCLYIDPAIDRLEGFVGMLRAMK